MSWLRVEIRTTDGPTDVSLLTVEGLDEARAKCMELLCKIEEAHKLEMDKDE